MPIRSGRSRFVIAPGYNGSPKAHSVGNLDRRELPLGCERLHTPVQRFNSGFIREYTWEYHAGQQCRNEKQRKHER